MEKKEFRAESKRLLDLMINSIYTHKEIFLRELISNASDAIDKLYYRALTDEALTFKREDFYIKLHVDQEARSLTLTDTGIGMTRQELEDNLGVIAQSGSLSFRQDAEDMDEIDIIGQFGVGFYSAFMVAETVTVRSRSLDDDQAYEWQSSGADGYTIRPIDRDQIGTEIVLQLKESSEDESYDEFLDDYRLQSLIKKYSDFIRYPIRMDLTKSRLKEGSEDEYESYVEEETINSMVPLWRKNRNELTDEDYENFYREKHYGFDSSLSHLHLSIDGMVSYNSILYIPKKAPFDYYTSEFEKGLELYSSGVMIMDRCGDLLPDYFSFVRGIVDSEDLSLNISRELLQHDRQLRLIAKTIEKRIKDELLRLLKDEREKYEDFYADFGQQLKYGVYSDFGMHKESLQDLLLFYSSKDKELVTLAEYVERMDEDQKYIYYAAGSSLARVDKLPQTELLKSKGYEILYLIDDVDEFALKFLMEYEDKEFRSVSSGDLGIEDEGKVSEEEIEENEDLFSAMKELLTDKVKDVLPSKRLVNHPVCFSTEGELSIEMEKVLASMPNNPDMKADKILEINMDHDIFPRLKEAFDKDKEKFELYTSLLYDQAMLIEGLPIEDPVEFSNKIVKLM